DRPLAVGDGLSVEFDADSAWTRLHVHAVLSVAQVFLTELLARCGNNHFSAPCGFVGLPCADRPLIQDEGNPFRSKETHGLAVALNQMTDSSRPMYRADQVGSFLRSDELKAARAAYQQGNLSLEQLREVEDRDV